jgi:3-dehydroquinate synthase
MKKLTLNAKDFSYDIFFGEGIAADITSLFALKGQKTCIISDSNVAPLYLEKVLAALGGCATSYVFPAGEASKSLDTCADIYNFLAKNEFSKTDALVALGGGICGDVTGFVSSTYLRGIPYFSLPTTLLAQVDSSIGGKCGVNIPYGKNLVGSFYQPRGVIIDTAFLKTLKERDFRDGLAEVIKYGFIYDEKICQWALSGLSQNLSDIVFRCVGIKKEVVEADEFDSGLRMILNFGHTIGHAIEKLGGYEKYSHGQAVSIGMAAAARLSEKAGMAKEGLYGKVVGILEKLGLPTRCEYEASQLLSAIFNDKKIRGGKLNFVLLKDIGQATVYPLDKESVEEFVEGAL